MEKHFFQKITAAVLAMVLTSSLLFGVFVPKVSAGGPVTPGEAIGKAVAAGISCFVSIQLEKNAQGWAAKYLGKPAKLIETGVKKAAGKLFSTSVPVNVTNLPEEVDKQIAADSVSESKSCFRDVIFKIIIDYFVDEVVAWIQSDGQHKPFYVTDWKTFSEDAYNVGAGQIIYDANLTNWLCKPFGLQITAILQPVSKFSERIKCTMDDVNTNLENFKDNFLEGGWLAYEQSLMPQNNFYGAYYMTALEAAQKGQESKEAAEREAGSSGGWLSVKECVKSLSQETRENAKKYVEVKQNLLETGYIQDTRGNWCLPENSKIVTPGAMVGQYASEYIVKKDRIWAENLKSWSTSVINAALNWVFRKGIGVIKEGLSNVKSSYEEEPILPVPQDDAEIALRKKEVERIKLAYEQVKKYIHNTETEEGVVIDEGILTDKKQSLITAGLIRAALDEIKKRNCQPAVTDEELAKAQTEIDRLNNEIAFYGQTIKDAEAGISAAQKIITADNFTDGEVLNLQIDYANFANKYDDLISDILSRAEEIKKDSAEEKNNKQEELGLAQSRLNLCSMIGTTP